MLQFPLPILSFHQLFNLVYHSDQHGVPGGLSLTLTHETKTEKALTVEMLDIIKHPAFLLITRFSDCFLSVFNRSLFNVMQSIQLVPISIDG
jgi:hypothetical protein